MMNEPALDLDAIKTRQNATWSAGDYSKIGVTLQPVGERLCEALDLRATWRVLDVAAGNGNASLAAARCGCAVTASDYVPALLEGARRRAIAEGLSLETVVADAERLPFEDASFDAVLSTFGVMFAPDQDAIARQLLRVCRPGGRIGLANWTPEGFIGQLFKIVGGFVPPPKGLRSPLLWGTEARLLELFPSSVASVKVERRHFPFRYRSAQHFVDVFREWYGPTRKAFEALPESRRDELAAAIVDLCRRFDRAGDGTLIAPGEYLEIVIDKHAR